MVLYDSDLFDFSMRNTSIWTVHSLFKKVSVNLEKLQKTWKRSNILLNRICLLHASHDTRYMRRLKKYHDFYYKAEWNLIKLFIR